MPNEHTPRTFSHEQLLELEDALHRAKHLFSVTTFSDSKQAVQFQRILDYKRKALERAIRITAKEADIPFPVLARRYGFDMAS